jgi:3-isopropylmalate dehydrogenase
MTLYSLADYQSSASTRWSDCLVDQARSTSDQRQILVGALFGEGVGREVVTGAIQILQAVLDQTGHSLRVEEGGLIGRQSEAVSGEVLPQEIVQFCESIFSRGGAILNGPGGGRYVYELRHQLQLFFKISPLQAKASLPEASRIKPSVLQNLDILVTRENTGGIYQGQWQKHSPCQPARHTFEYSLHHVERFLLASARLAASRRGHLTVVWKESGVPTISQLWRECTLDVAKRFGIQTNMVDIDLMAYRLIQEPAAFDVIAAPNLFGDVLGDLGAVLLGSRGNSFSANFNTQGNAVYQTNHGAAYDLAGKNRANPVGQILSMAMMLRESFGLIDEARAVEHAVQHTWQLGWRTEDVATPHARIIGTREFVDRVTDHAVDSISHRINSTSMNQKSRLAA